MIEQLFDRLGTAYYKVTFPDGNTAFAGCCWMADLLLSRWENETYAINYRGRNLLLTS